MPMTNGRIFALIVLIAAAAAARVIPHPPNFTPVGAMALFAGAYGSSIWQAVLVPVGAMVLSDLVIGWHLLAPVVYVSFIVIVGIGRWLRRERTLLRLVTTVGASSLSFFLITNFAVWAAGSMYPKSLPGLLAAYIAGIPFFRNTLLGDFCYSALLFGGFTMLERFVASVREAPRAASNHM